MVKAIFPHPSFTADWLYKSVAGILSLLSEQSTWYPLIIVCGGLMDSERV